MKQYIKQHRPAFVTLHSVIDCVDHVHSRRLFTLCMYVCLYVRAYVRTYVCMSVCIRMYVLNTLLYCAESWVIYRRHLRLIEGYHQRCLRTILNIHWSDFVTNIEVLEMANVTSIEAMLLQIQLRFMSPG